MATREGFTLVELLVGLLIAGIAVSIAAGIFTSTTDALAVMGRRGAWVQEEAAGIAWLRDGLLGAEVTTQPGDGFVGDSTSLRFKAHVPTARGWSESVTVTAMFQHHRLLVRVGNETYELPDSLHSGAFDYLTDYGSGSAWLSTFASRTGLPLAIRLRRQWVSGDADTTLLHVPAGRVQ